MEIADELAKLAKLRDMGALSESEFQAQKARLLAPTPPAQAGTAPSVPPEAVSSAQATDAQRKRRRLIVFGAAFVAFALVLSGVIQPALKSAGLIKLEIDANLGRLTDAWSLGATAIAGVVLALFLVAGWLVVRHLESKENK